MKAAVGAMAMVFAAGLGLPALAGSLENACAGPGWPSFCAIPPTPSGVRSPAQFHAAVLDVREAGARLDRQSAPSTFSLAGTDAFAAESRRAATPPPPMTMPEQATEAFVKEMRQRATPPHRRRP